MLFSMASKETLPPPPWGSFPSIRKPRSDPLLLHRRRFFALGPSEMAMVSSASPGCFARWVLLLSTCFHMVRVPFWLKGAVVLLVSLDTKGYPQKRQMPPPQSAIVKNAFAPGNRSPAVEVSSLELVRFRITKTGGGFKRLVDFCFMVGVLFKNGRGDGEILAS